LRKIGKKPSSSKSCSNSLSPRKITLHLSTPSTIGETSIIFYRHKANIDEEDSMWETNEDYQIKKLYKMAEGVNNYE
jgi:hypothetical protein